MQTAERALAMLQRRREWLLAAGACALCMPAASGARAGEGQAAAPAALPPLWHSRFRQGLADWGPLQADWGLSNHRFVSARGVPGQVLRVLLHRGGIDPQTMRARGLPRSGTGFRAAVLQGGALPGGLHAATLPGGLHAATLRYRLRFAPGFAFVRGGKLPGLFGGDAPSGGRRPDGRNGFSLRLMWREQGAGEVYAYLPTGQAQGSSLLRGAWQLQPGRWHTLVQQVQLNQPGRADGWVRMGVDGRWVGQASGLRLRDTAALRVDGVFFDLFHGGRDDSWAPAVDSHADFADFALWAGVAGTARAPGGEAP